MFRKVAAFGLAALLLVVAGCSSKPAATTPAPAADKTPAPVTITFWHTYNPDSNENKTLTNEVIPAFQKKYPNITVKAEIQPNDQLHDNLVAAVAAGKTPDVMRMDLTWTPEFAKQGALEAVDKYENFDAITKSVFPGTLQTNLYQGKHFGLPLDTNTVVMIYRKDYLKAAGLTDAPKTIDEFGKYLQASSVKGSKFAYAPGGNGGWGLAGTLFLAMGGKITSPDFTKATGFINSDASVKALQQLADWQKAGYFKDTNLGGQPGTWEGLKAGQYGAITDGPWFFAIVGNDPAIKDQVVAAPLPAGPNGSASVVGGEDIVMFANSKQKDAAWKFMQFMLSDEAQNMMAKTGQMPVTTTASNGDAMKSVAYYAPYITQLATAQPRTPSPAWTQIDKVLSDSFEAVLRGKTDAKAALDQAATQIDALLK